jgi:hypothetical protein
MAFSDTVQFNGGSGSSRADSRAGINTSLFGVSAHPSKFQNNTVK